MKKLISMVMAAAMVVSLVPATAFAADSATFKVVDDQEYTEEEAADYKGSNATKTITGPELQLKVTDVDTNTTTNNSWEVTLDFTNAELKSDLQKGVDVEANSRNNANNLVNITLKEKAEAGDDSVKLNIVETGKDVEEDDVLAIDLAKLGLVLTKASAGTEATVEFSGDFGDSDALVFAAVLDEGITVTVKKTADVAEEEETTLEKDMTIESNVGKFVRGQEFELKVNGGFELRKGTVPTNANYGIKQGDDEKELIVTLNEKVDEFTIDRDAIVIDAADAKVGATARITVKAVKNSVTGSFKATAAAVEVAKVVGSVVTLEVDEDADVPVIYSGVNVDNYGITDDSDHEALEVTLKEAAKGSLDVKKSFTLDLPEGVYVTNVDVTDTTGTYMYGKTTGAAAADVEEAFANAYKKGDHEYFEFARKVFEATDNSAISNADPMEMEFKLTLIAEPGFEGDVKLVMAGDAFEDEQEVTIAKFVSPYKVEAQTNDMIIDYRNTKVPTNVVVKEAEAGLWAKDLTFDFCFDKDVIELEDDATIKVDEKSDMELKNIKDMRFTVKDESSDEPAAVTISDISLYMGRSIAAGAYDLKVKTNAGFAMMTGDDGSANNNVDAAALFTAENGATGTTRTLGDTTIQAKPYFVADYKELDHDGTDIGDFDEKSFTVKEGFVNVVTAGRDQDDASFTTKVVVPVGEKYIVAGEKQIALDVPAYINAAGYTMLPVRAVATALGINNDNVLWDQATRTVTILYGQRIITMSAGEKVVYVNGSAIPAAAKVEIKDNRTFLPMRDLATALGVTDITWDAATKTATLNGNQGK